MPDSNYLDWKTYESITKYIYETLGKQHGVTIKGYGSTCTVIGNSGISHQIDVLTTHSDGMHTYDTAIECKYWKDKVNKDIVMKLSGIMEDTGINKGVIVSKSGFTPDGIALAKFKNIGLVELREAENKDLDSNSKEMHIADLEVSISAFVRRPEILSVYINDNSIIDIQDEFDYYKYIFKFENDDHISLITYVNDFRNEINRKNKEVEIITKRVDMPGSTLINRQTQSSIKVDYLTLTGQLRKIDLSRNLKIKLVDQVWLIMKSIFEERTFSFSENGLIVEHKKH